MPTAIALESARSAADRYTNAVIAERRLLAILPRPGHPDRPVVEGSLADVGRVARDAYGRYRGLILELLAGEHAVQAIRIILDVQNRTHAARTPVEITVSEDDS
jgi:hypothetical protein